MQTSGRRRSQLNLPARQYFINQSKSTNVFFQWGTWHPPKVLQFKLTTRTSCSCDRIYTWIVSSSPLCWFLVYPLFCLLIRSVSNCESTDRVAASATIWISERRRRWIGCAPSTIHRPFLCSAFTSFKSQNTRSVVPAAFIRSSLSVELCASTMCHSQVICLLVCAVNFGFSLFELPWLSGFTSVRPWSLLDFFNLRNSKPKHAATAIAAFIVFF